MTVIKEVEAAQLADLVKQVQAGNGTLLTQGDKPIATLVSATETVIAEGEALRIRSLKGNRVLTPVFSQPELRTKCLAIHDLRRRRLIDLISYENTFPFKSPVAA